MEAFVIRRSCQSLLVLIKHPHARLFVPDSCPSYLAPVGCMS